MARDARPARRARADRRRRRVRLPRRPGPAGARLRCSGSAWSGRSGSRRSRAACGGATCATTRASSPASRASRRHAARSARPLASGAPMPYDVAVIGLGRVGLPLALTLRRRRPLRARRRQRRRAARGGRARGRMPFKEPGTDELLARVRRSTLSRRARRRRRAGATRSCSRSARRAFSHIEIDMRRHPLGARRPAAACCAPASCSCCARRSRRARPSSSPATSRSSAASASARTCSSPTCPSGSPPTASWRRSARCRASSAASARARASAPRGCSSALGAPIVQTTPVQAELAKIWTNILRYATFALPNLLMMDCERYGANVFDVIDLINRDYPRGGIALPGLHRRHLPAQGLRVLGGALERARACCSPSRACNESVPLFLVDGIKRRLGGAARAQGRRARARLQGRHRRRARLALAQADPAARARAGRRRRARPGRRRRRPQPFEEAIAGADVVVVATNHTAYSTPGGARARSARARRPTASSSTRGTRFGAAQVFAYAASRSRCARSCAPMSRVLVTGGAGTIGAAVVRRLLARPRLRGPRVRPARRRRSWMREGCEVHTGDLRELDEAREAIARLHARHPPGRDRRRDRELPQAAAHADRGQQRALQRGLPRRARRRRRALHLRVSSSMVFERADGVPDAPRSTCPTARPALGLRLLEAHGRGLLPRRARRARAARTRSAARSTPTGPGEMPDAEPGIAHAVPDLIRKVARRPAPAADLRLGRADAHAHARRRHRRRDRDRDGASPAGLNEDFNISASEELTVAEIAAHRAGRRAATTRPSSSSSTCRASRSTSSAAGRRSRRPSGCSAGSARIGVARGHRARPSSGCANEKRARDRRECATRADHRHHGPGRLLPGRAAARARATRCTAWSAASSTEKFERIEHIRDRVTLHQGDLLDQRSLVDTLRAARPDEIYNLAAMSFVAVSWIQPTLTAEFTGVGVTRHARGGARGLPGGALLPGVLERDVRQGARDAADRGDAVLPALALRRGEGLRALHHRQLPRVLRHAALLRDPVQPRVAAPRARVRDAQDHLARGRDQARPAPTSCASATSTPSATGATPRTTSRRCG